MEKIKISQELRDYIERLNYEEMRYKDLLKSVSKDYMTQEEWESSFNYFFALFQEASISKRFALEEIKKIYNIEDWEGPWYVDFKDCSIVPGIQEEIQKNNETFQDQLNRLYPEAINEKGNLHINGPHVKDITLQVTDSCNMACSYCYQHDKNSHSMSFQTAKQFLDMILKSDERTNTYITSTESAGATINFIGGEPWLEIDLIEKISQYFINELFRLKHPWAIKFLFSVCSNGLLHFNPKVQDYLKKHNYHLNYSISIDGDKELHDSCRLDCNSCGTYDRAINGIKDYRKTFKRDIGSKVTIAPDNVDKIYEAIKSMVSEQGYTNINLNYIYEQGWEIHHAKILYSELCKITDWLFEMNLQDKISLSIFTEYCGKPQDETDNQNWCGGLGLMIALDYKGNIYPCLRYMETSSNKNNPQFIIGNINDGINILPEHQKRIQDMSKITRRSQSSDDCFNCPISLGCGWCSAYNYEVFGTPNKRATYICNMHKARVLANVYYWRRRGINFPMNCPKDWAVEIIGEEKYDYLNNMGGNFNNDYSSRQI